MIFFKLILLSLFTANAYATDVEVPCLDEAVNALDSAMGKDFTENELNADSLKYELTSITADKDNTDIKEFVFGYTYLNQDDVYTTTKYAFVTVNSSTCLIVDDPQY